MVLKYYIICTFCAIKKAVTVTCDDALGNFERKISSSVLSIGSLSNKYHNDDLSRLPSACKNGM